MKAAESEGPDVHFAVDKQSISLRPRGKSSLCSGSASRSVLLSAAPTNAASPAEPPPDTGPCPVRRKLLVVQAAAVVLLLGLSASVLLQAALCAVTVSPVSSEMSCRSLPPGCGDTLIGISTCMFVLKEMLFCAQETFTHFFISRVRPTPAVPLLFGALWAAANNDILQMVSQGWKYFRGNFYYFSQVSKTWYSAQQFCMSRDSQLTSVTSESEQEFLYRTAGGLSYWICLTKAGSEGDWSWVDDTPFDKVQSAQFWIPGEPNNEHCTDIKVSSLQSWNDVSCDSTLFFICKRLYSPSEP